MGPYEELGRARSGFASVIRFIRAVTMRREVIDGLLARKLTDAQRWLDSLTQRRKGAKERVWSGGRCYLRSFGLEPKWMSQVPSVQSSCIPETWYRRAAIFE